MKGKGKTLKDLKGMKVYLPELSVSHYLLVRGLENRARRKDVTVVNTSDADIVSAFGTAGAGCGGVEPAAFRHQRHAKHHRSVQLLAGTG